VVVYSGLTRDRSRELRGQYDFVRNGTRVPAQPGVQPLAEAIARGLHGFKWIGTARFGRRGRASVRTRGPLDNLWRRIVAELLQQFTVDLAGLRLASVLLVPPDGAFRNGPRVSVDWAWIEAKGSQSRSVEIEPSVLLPVGGEDTLAFLSCGTRLPPWEINYVPIDQPPWSVVNRERDDRFKCPGCHGAVAWRIHGPTWRPSSSSIVVPMAYPTAAAECRSSRQRPSA
jgi:hypothetical protein